MNDVAPTQRISVWKHVLLALILCLVGFNLFELLVRARYGSNLGNGAISFGLLINHLASFYTKTGWKRNMMFGVAIGWWALTAYLLWRLP